VADLEHHARRLVDQRPEVVHDRVLELANRVRDEAPPIEPGTEVATMLGITGSPGIEVADLGASRIEIRSTRGRVRVEAAADIAPADADRTSLAIDVVVRPQGFAANMMLGVALSARPQIRQELVAGIERGLDDLAVELAKPDDQWDAGAWMPPGLPVRS
jgi:hypothetical protein